MHVKINTIKQDLIAYIEYKNTLIKDIEEILQNESIDLDTRWDFFKNIPLEFSRSQRYDQTNKLFKDKDINGYDDLYLEKYQTANIIDIVERIEDSQEGEKSFKLKKYLTTIKQTALKMNLKQYIYDW